MSRIDIESQLRLVLDQFPGAAVHPADADGDFDYLYRRRSLLTRVADAERVRAAAAEILSRPADSVRVVTGDRVPEDEVPRVPRGVVLLTWDEPEDEEPERVLVPDLLDQLDVRFGRGIATPEHLLYVCGHCCAGTEPELPAGGMTVPSPKGGSCGDGQGVTVRIYDTGFVPEAATQHAWMAGVTGDPDRSVPPQTTSKLIEADGGHGTFVAGGVRLEAVRAEIAVTDMATRAANGNFSVGLAAEAALAARLTHDAPADIIVFSYAGETRHDLAMLAFASAWETDLKDRPELLIVAPAGNDSDSRPYFPAAFDWVVGVGALAENYCEAAHFSNYGFWVDVSAPGENAVNAFATGTYKYRWPSSLALHPTVTSSKFTGTAVWSGTSFSAPMVAGMVAARMSARALSSRQAWAELKQVAELQARFVQDPRITRILLPGQGCADAPVAVPPRASV